MPELFDVGAQAERTALAWQRTGIGTIAVGALVLRWCVTENFPLWPGVVLAMCGGITTLFLVRQRYQRVLRTVTTAQTPLSRFLVPGTTIFMVVAVLAVGFGVLYEFAHP
ncbi:MAG: DUF202 domain-containing protein [Mycobacterium sp.]